MAGARLLTRYPYNPVPEHGKLTIANAITDVTRLAGVEGDGAAYPDSSVGVWPAATNLVTNGGFETNTTGWAIKAGGETLARVTTTSKFGSACAQITLAGLLGYEGLAGIQNLALVNGTVYTAGAWVWCETGTLNLRIRVINVASVAIGTTTFVATTTPQRVSVTVTATADTPFNVEILTNGAQTGRLRVDGVSCYASAIDMPYIETDGGTASRSAGSITAIPAGVLDETQMWVMARIRVDSTQTGSGRIFSFGDSSNERLEMIITSTTNRTSTLRQTGGAGATASAASGTIAVGDAATYIGGWDANFCYAANNGAALTSAANTSIPTLSATDAALGKQGFASSGYPGVSLKWLAIGRAAPTDALSSLGYAWGNNDPLPHMFPPSAQLSFLAHFNGDGTFYRRSA